MNYSLTISVIGGIFVLVGLAAVIRPNRLQALARRLTVSTWLRVLAFAARVAIGVILIVVARSTAFPIVLEVIGTLLIVSGIAVLLIGNAGIQRLVDRALSAGPTAIVIGGIVAAAFGGFLIYATW